MELNSSLNSDNQPSPPALRPSSPTSNTSVPAALRKTIQTTKPRKKRAKSVKKCTIYKPEHTGLLLQIMNKLSEKAVQMKECDWKLSHIEHVNIKIGDLRKKAADKYEIYNVKPFFSTPEFSKGNFKLISNGRLIRHQVDECPFCHMIGEVTDDDDDCMSRSPEETKEKPNAELGNERRNWQSARQLSICISVVTEKRCGIRILTSHASDEETQTENED